MKTNFVKKIFRSPNYLSMPAVGVDITNHSVRYIDFNNKSGKLSIKKYGEIQLLPGVIKDGEILSKDILVKSLIELKNIISSNMVIVSIPEDKNYIFNIKIPKVPNKEIRQILEFKIEENVPLKLDEIFFDYEIIEESIDNKELFLNVSVVPKKIISEYSEVFNLAGLYPISFELESKMVACSIIPKEDKSFFMIINIKDDSTVLSIVSNEIVYLTSTISVGNYSILENLLKLPEYKENKINKSFDFNNNFNNNAFNSLLNIFSIFKDEVEKFFNYCSSEDAKRNYNFPLKIKKIFVCGKTSTIPGFIEHIIQNLDVEIEVANVWQNSFDIETSLPELKFFDSLDYSVPIGLALILHKK